jgi:hypothetical protein
MDGGSVARHEFPNIDGSVCDEIRICRELLAEDWVEAVGGMEGKENDLESRHCHELEEVRRVDRQGFMHCSR